MTSRTHRRSVAGRMHVWEVDRLIRLAADLPVRPLPLAELEGDLDTVYWFGGPDHQPTVRAVVDHAARIADADLSVPIILSADGIVMDGMHRVARAYRDGLGSINAVRFPTDPAPDRIEPLTR